MVSAYHLLNAPVVVNLIHGILFLDLTETCQMNVIVDGNFILETKLRYTKSHNHHMEQSV